MCVYLCKGIQECTRVQVPTEPEKDVRIPRAGVVGSCEPPGVDAGSQTLVLWKSIKRS